MSVIKKNIVALAISAALAAMVGSAGAAQGAWQIVLADQQERIALDTTRVMHSAQGITAWSRISLGREVADPAGRYNMIEAENLYDCAGGKFTTLRRVYLRNGTPVREESAVRERAVRVQPGSIDERLHGIACVTPATASLNPAPAGAAIQPVADSALAVQPRAGALPADMRSLSADAAQARVLRVSDAHGAPEKPRMIELPKIDKEALSREAAAAVGGAGAPTKPADVHGAAAAASAAAAAHGAAPAPLPLPKPAPLPPLPSAHAPAAAHAPAPVQVPAPSHAPSPKASKPVAIHDMGVSGHAREVMLATSGPRKAAKHGANPAEEMHAHWGYEGPGAPANWGKLDPKNATCDIGRRQSPIDIRPGIAVDLEPIKMNYKPSKFSVVDNGHTIQVNVGAGNVINVMGKRFELAQFHFHKPSEERVNGRPYPMVIHFVHKDWDDNLAVIAVLLDEGSEHGTLQKVWDRMPLEAGSEVDGASLLDIIKLFPDDRSYWTYMGSLTTPPCSENVLWMVMRNPIGVSPEQIGTFSRLYRHNARPIQPNNGRLIKESR
jgi:carbonic anhydrase